MAEHEAASIAGKRVGPYRLLRRIARGGMGTVYLAARDDDQYQKKVAVKLVRRGMDTEDVLRRFLAERQILARLEHPHIARLIDGGATDDDRPYFVMEYVESQPLDAYCNPSPFDCRAPGPAFCACARPSGMPTKTWSSIGISNRQTSS